MERQTWDLASVWQDYWNIKTRGFAKECLGVFANGGKLLLTDIAEIVGGPAALQRGRILRQPLNARGNKFETILIVRKRSRTGSAFRS
jgi:hypothetical protein